MKIVFCYGYNSFFIQQSLFGGCIGENYFAKHSPQHQWYYYPAITSNEALLIKQWDSAGNLALTQGTEADAKAPEAPCTFSFHTAFEDPSTPPDAPDRWSIEVRCIVLYN